MLSAIALCAEEFGVLLSEHDTMQKIMFMESAALKVRSDRDKARQAAGNAP